MKLNNKRTVLVGLAFLSICSFWQMYNNVIPLILTNTFHLNETWSGVIMAADNVLALFLLPLFGGISDRSGFRMGRRKPFILFGTIAAVVLMMLLPLLDDSYFTQAATWKLVFFIAVLGALLIAMGTYRSPAVALMPDVTPKPLRSKANAIINLMGAVGGILYLIITSVLYSKARVEGKEHVSYLLLFAIVAGIMLLALLILMTTVDEPALAAKAQEYERLHPEDDLPEIRFPGAADGPYGYAPCRSRPCRGRDEGFLGRLPGGDGLCRVRTGTRFRYIESVERKSGLSGRIDLVHGGGPEELCGPGHRRSQPFPAFAGGLYRKTVEHGYSKQ